MKYVLSFWCLLLPSLVQSQELLLAEHNQARTQSGWCGIQYFEPAPALIWDTALAKAAQRQARLMANQGRLQHRLGGSLKQRLGQLKIDYRRAGENIAYMPNTQFDVMQEWLKSAIHCQNILNPGFGKIGVASAEGYWAAIFTD